MKLPRRVLEPQNPQELSSESPFWRSEGFQAWLKEELKVVLEGLLVGQETENKKRLVIIFIVTRVRVEDLPTNPTNKFQTRQTMFSGDDGVSGCGQPSDCTDWCEKESQHRVCHRNKRGHFRGDLVPGFRSLV